MLLNMSSDAKDNQFDAERLSEKFFSPVGTLANQVNFAQNCCAGFSKYLNEFMIPYLVSVNYFADVEKGKFLTASPWDNFQSYMELMEFNLDLSNRCMTGSMKAINDYNKREMQNMLEAWYNTFSQTCFGYLTEKKGNDINDFVARQSKIMEWVTHAYPQAIRDIEPEFGFHFENPENGKKIAETDRFTLYQVFPRDKKVTVNKSGKPILILPPYVLGASILAFLPGENKSYTHCYANMGIPTYIRVLKDISVTPALQTMAGEDDALDTKFFCEKIKARHGKSVTLNGYCQGGFMAICDLLSGELDGLVDVLITCVAPMDGTRSTGLKAFLHDLPQRFNDLAYGVKTLPNGNRVADGKLMGWVYKLKSIENEAPMVVFFRDMMMLSPRNGADAPKISKSAAAINYWLDNERTDLPMCITEMSFASYNIPVTGDGTLPIKLFGRELNFKRIQEKGVKWLICYGENDDLVEKETALAPQDFIDVEVTSFPKGHVAIATSWSNPKSACALHTRFGEKQHRGPVRFHLDMDKEISERADRKKSQEKQA